MSCTPASAGFDLQDPSAKILHAPSRCRTSHKGKPASRPLRAQPRCAHATPRATRLVASWAGRAGTLCKKLTGA
eukprot:2632201-Karenia_brevis.AAC.1